ARNGADRLVSGTEIQTKYCSTAARSVGAAFDGQNGQYRYMGNHGPMQLEVPRDQYAGAVETMKNKIREGKVPGVTDPIRRQLVLPTRANYTGRTLQCDIKSRLLLPSLSFSCSFHLSVR
ncbi:hypothetical protein U9244_26585, partial [Escherichia coli]